MTGLLAAALLSLAACTEAPDDRYARLSREAVSSPSAILEVESAGDRVSVRAHDVPMQELLEEIARQNGLTLVVYDILNEKITIELDRVRLPKALRRILRHENFALQYAGAAADEATGKLWVFSPGEQEPDRSSHLASAIEALARETRSPYAHRRREAVEALGAFRVQEAIDPLTLALADEDSNVRLEAVSALAAVGGDTAVTAISLALGDMDAVVREEAADALGDVGRPSAIPALGQALMDRDKRVREAAIEAFAQIGGEDSALALAAALNDGEASIREEAVDALADIGGNAAVRLLEQALADERSQIREAAAESLAELLGGEE